MHAKPLRRGHQAILATALVCGLTASPAFGALVLLDNTAQGTAALNAGSSTGIGDDGAKGVVFSVDQDLDLESITFGLYAPSGAVNTIGDIALYGVDGSNNPTGSPISSVTTPALSLSPTPDYFTVNLTGISVPSGDNYALILQNFSSGTLWNTPDPSTAPTPDTGVTFVGYRFSLNGGTSWSSSTFYNSIYLQAASGAVPTPATLALMLPALGAIVAMRRRREKTTC